MADVETHYFDDVPRSKYVQGFDFNYKEEATRDIMYKIEDLYLQGFKQGLLYKIVARELGIKVNFATKLVNRVCLDCLNSGKLYLTDVKNRNALRLERLYGEAIRNGNFDLALKTITELNKMCGCYINQIEVQNTNFVYQLGGNTEEIQTITTITENRNNEENELIDE